MRAPIPFRRRLGAPNAGSMADIAFLLLVFFLVTTTLDREHGIPRLLAPMAEAPPAPVHPRDVLPVLVNEAGELLVKGVPTPLEELRAAVTGFLTNPGDHDDLPRMLAVTEAECLRRMAALGDGPERALWEQRLDAVRLIGPYREPSPNARIVVQVAAGSSYATYIAVQDELEGAVGELRDAVSERAFGRPYAALVEHDPKDRERIMAIRRAVPLRIGDGEPVGGR